MDSPPVESFDRLARLAARILKAPVALVSLVDDQRQYSKSIFGEVEPWRSQREFSLSQSMCRYVVEAGSPIVVTDARTLPGYKDCAAVTKYGLVAYAGIPIRTPSGHVLGALCVLDVQPHAWSDDDIEILSEITNSVNSEIELETSVREANDRSQEIMSREARKRAILQSALDCIITIDVDGNVLEFNPAAEATFGFEFNEVLGKPLADFIIPEHLREAHRNGLKRHLETGEARVLGKRIEITAINAAGVEFPVELAISPIQEPARLFTAYLRDISERRDSAIAIEKSRSMLATIQSAQSQFIAVEDVGGTFDTLLTNLLQLTESDAGFIGEVLISDEGNQYLKTHSVYSSRWDDTRRIVYNSDRDAGLDELELYTIAQSVLSSRDMVLANGYFNGALADERSLLGVPFFHGDEMVGVVGIAKSGAGYDAELTTYLAPLLTTCASLIAAYRVRQQRLLILESLQVERNFKSAVFDTVGALVIVLDRTGTVVEFNRACEEIMGYSAVDVIGRPIWEAPFYESGDREGSIMFWANLSDDWAPEGYETRWESRGGDPKLIAWTMSALRDADGRIINIISCGIDITKQQANEAALVQARKNEVAIGYQIQQTLLVTRAPATICGFGIGTLARASQGIDGDYFELFNCGKQFEHFDFLIGDVMGKGATAALLGAASKSQFQRAIRRLIVLLLEFGRPPEPAEIMAAVHCAMTSELVRLDSFITLCYARFNPWKRCVTMIDCGHTRTILYRRESNSASFIQGNNLPLGVRTIETYIPLDIPLSEGDVMLFYSDGVTDAENEAGEFFGEERLLQTFMNNVHLIPQQLVDAIFSNVGDFTGRASLTDDFTCVAVRFDGDVKPLPLVRVPREFASSMDQLENIRTFVREFCQQTIPTPLSDDATHLLILAIHEAITNIIIHAYDGRENERIQIIVEYYADTIIFYLHDTGLTFDPTTVPDPDFDGSRDGGFGIFIISQCMDEVHYDHYDLGRNCLTLIRNIGPDDLLHPKERAKNYEI